MNDVDDITAEDLEYRPTPRRPGDPPTFSVDDSNHLTGVRISTAGITIPNVTKCAPRQHNYRQGRGELLNGRLYCSNCGDVIRFALPSE